MQIRPRSWFVMATPEEKSWKERRFDRQQKFHMCIVRKGGMKPLLEVLLPTCYTDTRAGRILQRPTFMSRWTGGLCRTRAQGPETPFLYTQKSSLTGTVQLGVVANSSCHTNSPFQNQPPDTYSTHDVSKEKSASLNSTRDNTLTNSDGRF